MESVWDLVPAVAGTLVGGAFCAFFARKLKPIWLLIACLYFILDVSIVVHAPPFPHTHWNWSGKLLSVLFGLAVFAALRSSREEVGLCMPQTRFAFRWSAIGIAAAVMFAGTINYLFRDGKVPHLETLLFQASMPGLSEELAFRGIGFALVARAFAGARGPWKVLAPILISSLVFALGHGYSHDNGSSSFYWMPFAYSLILGLWLAVVRWRTGSLLGPVLAHNAANTLGAWISGLH